jgi:plastocyanin
MKTTCALLVWVLAINLPLQAANSFTVRDQRGNPIADAVVSLLPLDVTPDLTPGADAVIAQDDKEYDPYVTALVVGTRVNFPNRDSIQHHIYSLSRAKRFEKPLYGSGAEESVVFDQPGVVVLGCNIHDWMIAYVVVLGTPYFAKTDIDGRATIIGPAAGRYRLEIWHPRVTKSETRELTVNAGGDPVLEVSLSLKPDRRIRRAPENKTGGY